MVHVERGRCGHADAWRPRGTGTNEAAKKNPNSVASLSCGGPPVKDSVYFFDSHVPLPWVPGRAAHAVQQWTEAFLERGLSGPTPRYQCVHVQLFVEAVAHLVGGDT